jgi:hypothetical protein
VRAFSQAVHPRRRDNDRRLDPPSASAVAAPHRNDPATYAKLEEDTIGVIVYQQLRPRRPAAATMMVLTREVVEAARGPPVIRLM